MDPMGQQEPGVASFTGSCDSFNYFATALILQFQLQKKPVDNLFHSHRLRQVTWLVDVRTLEYRNVVREQL